MLACRDSTPQDCINKTSYSINYIKNSLPNDLNVLFKAIKDKAKNAKVVMLGYPHLIDMDGSCPNPSTTRSNRQNLQDLVDAFVPVAEQAIRDAGSKFVFVDGRKYFAGHEMCSRDPYLDINTLHPTDYGHKMGWLPALKAGVG
jgi:hypothetical protein